MVGAVPCGPPLGGGSLWCRRTFPIDFFYCGFSLATFVPGLVPAVPFCPLWAFPWTPLTTSGTVALGATR